MVWEVIMLDKTSDVYNIFGNLDVNIKILEKEYNVSIINRDLEIKIYGEPENIDKAKKVINSLISLSNNNQSITEQNVRYAMSMVEDGLEKEMVKLNGDCICISAKGRAIKPKTVGQRKYIEMIKQNTIVLGVGPAGTGKTYLAVAMAASALRNKEVAKIILTRPAVEAGEKLGFLPGDLQQKVDPYLRPLYDALFDMLGAETYQKYVEKE
jgi:phosphate starvation-inducible PhoH-like protein